MEKKKYNKEFKLDVVGFYKSHNFSKKEVALKFGMHPTSLKNWVNEIEKYQDNSFVGTGNLHKEDEEIKNLKRQIYDLKEENAILKKAAAIFSKGI